MKKSSIIKKIAIAVVCIIIGVVIYNSLPGVVLNKRINAFNNLYSFYEKNGKESDIHSDLKRFKQDKLVKRCGLGLGNFDDGEYVMDNEFVDAYIEKYSIDEFIEKLYFIYSNISNKCGSYDRDYCNARTTNAVLLYALECANIELQYLDIPDEGVEGYYTENPDAVPEDGTWTTSGMFYSSSGENRNSQTRTNTKTVTIHGDFAVEHFDTYEYSKGVYEWRNGTFVDQLPKWRHVVYDVVYYKGKELDNEWSYGEVFTVGETLYILYDKEYCSTLNTHYSRKWDALS